MLHSGSVNRYFCNAQQETGQPISGSLVSWDFDLSLVISRDYRRKRITETQI